MPPSQCPCNVTFSKTADKNLQLPLCWCAPSCRQKKHTRGRARLENADMHCVVRKNRHEGEQRSTNAGMRHRAVRKDTHADAARSSAGAASSCGQKRHTQDGATASNLITQTIVSSSHTAAPHVFAAADTRRDLPLRNGFPWLWNCKVPGEAVGFRHHCKNAATSAATPR